MSKLNFQEKIVSEQTSEDELSTKISTLKKPLVFTNGCFDILHLGHITYLQEARNLGQSLVVAVNTDKSVKRQQKGFDRPINILSDRMALLASLACVDLVVSFDHDTPLTLIETIKPEHLVKGGDWAVDKIVGSDVVSRYGGQVHSIAFQHKRSTTELLNRIRTIK